jgi:hypothetical protein
VEGSITTIVSPLQHVERGCCSNPERRLNIAAMRLSGSTAMNTSQITGLRDFPDRNGRTFVEIDRIDKRIHDPMKPDSAIPRSDKSYCGRN